MTSSGLVKLTPLSVPASYGNNSLTTRSCHSPVAVLHKFKSRTPRNQSGEGANMVMKDTRGYCELTSILEIESLDIPPSITGPLYLLNAFFDVIWTSISALIAVMLPENQ